MPRIAIEVGSLLFPTKSAAVAHFKVILHAHPVNERIPEPYATELDWLLDRHPEVEQKRGAGVVGSRTMTGLYGTKCFVIDRVDESSTDFSYLSCVDGKAPTPQQEIIQAMRAEVRGDIQDAKRRHFAAHADAEGRVACAITGDRVAIEECHADHAPPRTFSTLALAFLKARRIVPDRSQVTAPADNQMEPRLLDRALASDWREFHREMAAIRIVTRRANMERNAEAKVRKKDRQLILG